MRDTDIFLGVARTKLAQMLPGIQGAGAPTSDPSASPSGVANAAASPGAMAGQSAAPTAVGAPQIPKGPKAWPIAGPGRAFAEGTRNRTYRTNDIFASVCLSVVFFVRGMRPCAGLVVFPEDRIPQQIATVEQ